MVIKFNPEKRPVHGEVIDTTIQKTIQKTTAKKTSAASILAQSLDAMDGKQDGNISASVWNEFVKDKGGKTIKYSITVENAEKSIAAYLSKNSEATGKDKDALSADWIIDIFDKNKKLASNENDLCIKDTYNPKDPKVIKSTADSITKYITGKSEGYTGVSSKNAAQVLEQLNNDFNGKIPLTLGTHMFIMMNLYPALLEQAKDLGIPTNYTKDTNFGDGMYEVCKNRLKACMELKELILKNEQTMNYPQ